MPNFVLRRIYLFELLQCYHDNNKTNQAKKDCIDKVLKKLNELMIGEDEDIQSFFTKIDKFMFESENTSDGAGSVEQSTESSDKKYIIDAIDHIIYSNSANSSDNTVNNNIDEKINKLDELSQLNLLDGGYDTVENKIHNHIENVNEKLSEAIYLSRKENYEKHYLILVFIVFVLLNKFIISFDFSGGGDIESNNLSLSKQVSNFYRLDEKFKIAKIFELKYNLDYSVMKIQYQLKKNENKKSETFNNENNHENQSIISTFGGNSFREKKIRMKRQNYINKRSRNHNKRSNKFNKSMRKKRNQNV